ncbi:hypothetical protein SKAU_G00408180 [Synaphobranchus kaupii]|uniref:Uncharacterized protein n=1 Tax=Synaphobranchus kaupii TaxID=118154 RepID=A0A9Q1EAF2_SYNKA|nr:hypothetical protein SKAU_G00408180 [Synaphobranchus kaupii]
MNSVEEWVLNNKSKIEKGVELLGQGCEALAGTVGKLHPLLEAAFLASAKLLHDPESKDSVYLQGQLRGLDRALAGITKETAAIAQEMQRSSLNKQNFDREAQVISQYEKFRDFLESRPEFRERRRERFLVHFESTGADLSLVALYNAVVGASADGEPLLDAVVAMERRSRRAVEEFCAQLKRLFLAGVVAVLGHAALRGDDRGRELVRKWQERLEEVEERARAAVEDCIRNFAAQAKEDVERRLQGESGGGADARLVRTLLDLLSQKYDWVSWSVCAVKHRGMFLWDWLAGREYHGRAGGRDCSFDVLTTSNAMVQVSFSVRPQPIDKSRVQEEIHRRKLKGKMAAVALSLGDSLSECAVLAVSRYKEVAESNTFPEDCYYYKEHRRAYLCIHSK